LFFFGLFFFAVLGFEFSLHLIALLL
jgi:hypothetical protein